MAIRKDEKCYYCDKEGTYFDFDNNGQTISVCLKHIMKYFVS